MAEGIGAQPRPGPMAETRRLLVGAPTSGGYPSAILSAVDALLYPSIALGAHGAIAAILTAAPTLCVTLWDAVRRSDHPAALALHQKLLPLWNALNADNLPANVKYAMELQNRPAGEPRAPMPKPTPAQAGAIRAALEGAGLLGAAN